MIADSKFGKSRQVFLHPTAVAALRGYQRRRDRWCPAPAAPSFFVSTRGTRLDEHNLPHTFAVLLGDAGIAAPPGRRRPRIHDLRHYADGRVMCPAGMFGLAGAVPAVFAGA